MVRVLATGVFDLLHLGHLHFLEKARELGDELVVVVATDNRVRELKHEPVTPQEMRADLVAAFRPVDRAVVGKEGDMFSIVEEIEPDIIAIGYDQEHDEEKIKAMLAERGLDVRVVRLPKLDADLDGTRKIIRKICEVYSFQKKIEAVEAVPAEADRKRKKEE